MRVTVSGIVTHIENSTKNDKPICTMLLNQGKKTQAQVRFNGHLSDEQAAKFMYKPFTAEGDVMVWSLRSGAADLMVIAGDING